MGPEEAKTATSLAVFPTPGEIVSKMEAEVLRKERFVSVLGTEVVDSWEFDWSIFENPAVSFGDASVFSFHRTKTITTGEGGILLLDDEAVYNRAKFLRDHGRSPGTYYNTEVTYKYMPSNLAASLGYAQFLRIDELVNKKRSIWSEYSELLKSFDFVSL
jgi:hypothetical protein